MPRLFVDMDGVLADFDTGYAQRFGPHGGKEADNVDWELVRCTEGFYRDLPPMPDLHQLWEAIAPLEPTVLTGVPPSVPEAAANKRAWLDRNLGADVPMIACASKDKCLHGQRGDILIDDWDKYRQRWLNMGGFWVTHQSAQQTISGLFKVIFGGSSDYMVSWFPLAKP